MNKKMFALLGVFVLLSTASYAQHPLKMAKRATDMTGGVPSAFSKQSPVAVVTASVIDRKIASAQVMLSQADKYISSADLFARVAPLSSMQKLPAVERKALEVKFAQLDLSVQTATNKDLGYLGALWSSSPAVTAQTLQTPHVQNMTQLLDIQRYMQLNADQFPQLFQMNQGGWLYATSCLSTPAGNRAFVGVVDILVRQQYGRVPEVIVNQLVQLHASARNALTVEQVVKQLESWRAATGNLQGAPQLPKEGGFTLRANPEDIWLATEIRLLQLTPGIELPQILKEAKVSR
ncbi:MAG: hypothetical protein IKW71_01645 [Elusimicrobiaceae bacterium]|nr:hypothetical protein [Elusimicrobiaceae bacterium]